MIDYSIMNPTKQIWINLELYFESYDFYKFIEFSGNFSEFNLIYFRIFFIFNLNKKWEKGGLTCACTRGSATWTRGPPTWRRWHGADAVAYYIYYIYMYIT